MDKTPGATGQRVVVTGEGIHESESSDQGLKQKRLCQRQIASNSTEAMVTHTNMIGNRATQLVKHKSKLTNTGEAD